MARLRVHAFTISIDGYGAGPRQDLQNPLGAGGVALHEWVFGTRTFSQMHGGGGATTGIDDDFAARGAAGIGAWIMSTRCTWPSLRSSSVRASISWRISTCRGWGTGAASTSPARRPRTLS